MASPKIQPRVSSIPCLEEPASFCGEAGQASTFTEPILVLVVIVAIAVLYPALKAALIRPVDAMHHQ